MKCFKCNHENAKGSKFCSNCGKNFQTKNNHQNNQKPIQNIYPDNTAIQMHADRLKEKAHSPITACIVYIIILLVAFVFSLPSLVLFYCVAFVALIVPFGIVSMTKIVTEEYYYTIPTAKDSNGEHHCIFCGNKGLYKSTIYKTSTTVNACSKCKAVLFHS